MVELITRSQVREGKWAYSGAGSSRARDGPQWSGPGTRLSSLGMEFVSVFPKPTVHFVVQLDDGGSTDCVFFRWHLRKFWKNPVKFKLYRNGITGSILDRDGCAVVQIFWDRSVKIFQYQFIFRCEYDF